MKQTKLRMAVNDLFRKKETARIAALDTPWTAQSGTPWEEYPPSPAQARQLFLSQRPLALCHQRHRGGGDPGPLSPGIEARRGPGTRTGGPADL